MADLCRYAQGSTHNEDLPDPDHVQGQPKELVCTYTDGSVDPSSQLDRAIVGVGIWTNTTLAMTPMHSIVTELAYEGERAEGAALHSSFGSYRPSSTRAEIMALIVAMFLQKPIHVGVDSSTAVKRLRAMIQGKPMKPWFALRDGDLLRV